MGVSRSTLYRCLENTNLIGFTDLSDQELDQSIANYKETHSHDGEITVVAGYSLLYILCTLGYSYLSEDEC